jgi:hypothetical protein
MKYLVILTIFFLLDSTKLYTQITFDYSAVDLILEQFTKGKDNTEEIVAHPGYKHILEHSKKYSSSPITDNNLRNSLKLKSEGFNFSNIAKQKEKFLEMIKFLKANEGKIINEYAKLCLKYLPKDYKQEARIFYIIGGYNGIAFDNKICMNIDFAQFKNNYPELLLYISHELFHIGFEKYQALPNILAAKTVQDLKTIAMSTTMNEGLATLTPYHLRVQAKELNDYDYKTLLDPDELNKKIKLFNSIMKYLDDNINKELVDSILGYVLGECSKERLFYIVGCYMGLQIEDKYGADKIKELTKLGSEDFFRYFNE